MSARLTRRVNLRLTSEVYDKNVYVGGGNAADTRSLTYTKRTYRVEFFRRFEPESFYPSVVGIGRKRCVFQPLLFGASLSARTR